MTESHELDEREWALQENARRAEGDGAAPDRGAAVNRYRLVARALREPPLAPIPRGFAAAVAASAVAPVAPSDRLEAWLQHALLGLLAIVAAGAVAAVGGPVLVTLAAAGRAGVGWGVAAGACVAASFALDLLTRRKTRSRLNF
jgi:hypothetical protein